MKRLATLTLKDLRVLVHLGCTEQERANSQPVDVSVVIQWPELPKGALTDQLEDTVCYAKVAETIQSVATRKPYALIEALGAAISTELKSFVTGSFRVKIHKLHPPVDQLRGGALFEWGEVNE